MFLSLVQGHRSQAKVGSKKVETEMKRKQKLDFLKGIARQRRNFIVPGTRFQPNPSQREALQAALTDEFTLIQGPPGTGKTVTGAYLVYFFSQHNQQLPDTGDRSPQILYCGPSNKSVDVITGILKVFFILYYVGERWGMANDGNGEHLISSKIGKEDTMKIFYGNYCSFTRLWCVVIWEIYLNFVVKISKKQVNGFVYFSVM